MLLVTKIMAGHQSTYVFLGPGFHRSLDPFLRVDPPIFGHVGQMSQAEVVQMNQKPFGFFLRGLRLVRLEGQHIELGCVNDLPMRLLKEVENKLQKRDKDVVFLDTGGVVLLDGQRLIEALVGNPTRVILKHTALEK